MSRRYPGFEIFMGLRYLKHSGRGPFARTIQGITIGGIAIGVFALIVAWSLMNGFESDLRSKILGTTAHLAVFDWSNGGVSWPNPEIDRLNRLPGIKAVAPFIYNKGMIQARSEREGVMIRGIDPRMEKNATRLKRFMEKGQTMDMGPDGVLLGRELALNMMVDTGDTVMLAFDLERGPTGMVPKARSFTVKGIFHTGFYEFDSSLVYVDLSVAQTMYGMQGKAGGLEITINNPAHPEPVARAVEKIFGGTVEVRTWKQMRRNLYFAMKVEKVVMFIIQIIIICVAAFNIVTSLVTKVLEKTKDIGILRAMGATSRHIRRIFMFEGMIMGIIGTFIGLASGFAASLLLKQTEIIRIPADVYYLDRIPVDIRPWDFLIVAAATLAVSFLATIYPARKAAALNPIEAIRNV